MSEDLERTGLSRRTVITGASAGVAGLVAAQSGLRSRAQDATPEPTGGQDSPASPEATPNTVGPEVPPEVTQYANDWPMAQGNLFSDRNAASTTIDSGNVDTLGIAWELPLSTQSGYGAITSNPVVQGDTVYIIDNQGNVKALDRETGEVRWAKDYNVDTLGPNGVAVGYGYLVSVLGDDCTVVCHMADTGDEAWRYRLSNHNALGITMAPLIYDNYVIVSTEPGGNSKGTYEGGATGVVFCLDLATGVTLWTFDTTVDQLWGNFLVNSGGGLWYPPSVDENGVLYMGIGNAAPFPGTEEFPNASSRPGDNDYANCIVALDPNQGQLLWYLNVNPHDLLDHDNQETPVLADVEDRKLVFTGGKHGYVVGLDRESGKEIWRTAIGTHQNDDLEELPTDDVDVFPGVLGGINSPMAYANGKVFAAAINASSSWNSTTLNYGEFSLNDATGSLVALDALTGEVVWNVDVSTGIAGPGPTIANDILFTGGLDGIVRAYRIDDGTLVWSYQAAAGLNAPYAIAGDMLLVPAGSFILPSSDTEGEAPEYRTSVIAFRLGASGATPEATPAS